MLEHHLEKLIVFVGVVDSGSIRKYAISRRLSQPGVSQRISALERQVGIPLLNRSRYGIELTKQGRLVYQLGRKLIEQSKAVEVELYKENEREVEIKFGTYDSVAIYLMPNVIEELQKRLPHVRLKLHCDRSANVLLNLEEGLLDCGLCMASQKQKRLEIKPLYEDRYGFFISAGGSRNQVLVTVPDAADQTGKIILSHIKNFGLHKHHLLSAPSFEIAKAMTLAGLGIGILPHRVAAQGLRGGSLRKATMPTSVPPSFGLHSFGFAQRKGTPESAEVRILLDIIQNEQKRQVSLSEMFSRQ